MRVILLILLLLITTESFKFKTKITGQTNDNGRIDVEIMIREVIF